MDHRIKTIIKLYIAMHLILIGACIDFSDQNRVIQNENYLAKTLELKLEEQKNNDERTELVYTVKKGDSLYRIADKYKVHIYQIREWNDLGSNSLLRPGQEIIIKRVDYQPIEGLASWYGPNFHGQPMANGEIYNMNEIIVAHRTLPLGRKVRITNLENGRSIIAPVLDRGPYVINRKGEYTREIDLSYKVAQELGTIKKGVVLARIEPINKPLPID
ncbi:septal ring lytic transglycosylase RlpA family protein [Patescibacteria group bacterium]